MFIQRNENGDTIYADDCPLNGKNNPTVIFHRDGSSDEYDPYTGEHLCHKEPELEFNPLELNIAELEKPQIGLVQDIEELKQEESKMNLKIFLSGPMTGYPNFNFKAFDYWEKTFKDFGYEVVNPAHISRKFKKDEVLKHGEVFKQMVAEQFEVLKDCNAIFLLDGWDKSAGVRKELSASLELGHKILLETNFKKDFLFL